MIVPPSCPPAPTPRPLRAKRCASFRALSTSVKDENSQLQLIPSCRAIRPAFAEARGQTLKFRGAPANEAAPDRAAIVPRKLRNRQKMNERLFAERELVQEIWKRTVPTRRNFAQRRFNLDRIERSLGLRFYPARLRAHRAFELTRKRDQGSVCESIFSRACSSSRRSRRLKLARPRREIFSSKGSTSSATN